MASNAAYFILRRRKAKRRLEDHVAGIEIEHQDNGDELVVVDAETDEWLATLESCQEAAEPDVDLSFTPQIRVEYRTDPSETGAGKLRQIKDHLTAAASKWQW